MKMIRDSVLGAVMFALCWSMPALAQTQDAPTTYDCGEIYDTEANKSFQLDPALIEYCVLRGWDPPGATRPNRFNWQPVGGKAERAGATGSTQLSGRQSPASPPGSSSSGSNSASESTASHNIGLPNLSGSGCIAIAGQNVCPSCEASGEQSSCSVNVLNPQTGEIESIPAGTAAASVPKIPNPVGGDLTGRLGAITRLVGGQKQLSCGGSVTINAMEVATVPNATHLLIAQGGMREVNIYSRNGNNYSFLREVKLDGDLCGADGSTRPTDQFIFFNQAQPFVVIRVIQPLEEAQEQENPPPLYNTGSDEKYVLAKPGPLIAGADRPSCEEFKRYPSNVQDFRITPATAPEDDAIQLPLNTSGCEGNTLHIDLSNPSLVHQPGRIVQSYNIAGRDEVATSTTQTSILFTQPESFLRLGTSGASFVFTGSTVLDLPDQRALHMYSPTTVTGGAAGSILLEGGGHVEDNDGNVVQRFAPNTRLAPPGVAAPYYVVSDQRVYLPAGLTLLSTRAGIIREPVAPPPAEGPVTPPSP